MNIFEIYTKYKIMPQLETHMLRVASVAKIISESFSFEVDTENIVKAMLLHDMGNILKFNLALYPEFSMPLGVNYWTHIKEDYQRKYGLDEHIATERIAKEINVNERVFELLLSVGFSKSEENLKTNDLSKKICCYSDQRVTPFGIASLTQRLEDGRKRFLINKGISKDDVYEKGFTNLLEIEKQIFDVSNIKPEDIDDEKVNALINTNYFSSLIF